MQLTKKKDDYLQTLDDNKIFKHEKSNIFKINSSQFLQPSLT